MSRAIRTFALAVLFAALAAGCASSPGASPGPSAVSSSAPSATTANQLTSHCSDSSPCVLTAGTWITSGINAFIPGLSIMVAQGWSSPEADAGELKLIPADHPDDAVFLWKDVGAIESNGEQPKDLIGVPRTPEGLTAAFQKNPDYVVSTPSNTTIAGNVPALTYTLGVSPSAAYTDHGCPSYPTCANILRDPVHWLPTDFYAIGSPEVIRLYLATVGTSTDRHTLVISLDATDPVELERLTLVAAPIIASIRLPAVIGDQ